MRTQRQKERCEAMRRLQVERYRKATLVRCDMIAVPVVETVYDEKTGQPVGEETVYRHEPKCAQVLQSAGIAWGQVWRRGTHEQLVWFEHAMIEELRRLDGVAEEKVDDLDFDALVRPFADRAVGHFSYAHTSMHLQGTSYTFDTDYNPASADTNWTHTRNGTVENGRISSGRLRGGISYIDAYTYDPLTVMCVPDYSVEANCYQYTSFDYGILGRAGNGWKNDPAYWLLMDNGKFDLVYRPKSHTTSGQVTLASYGSGLGSGLCRLEMVGTTLKGYQAGVERIGATDATLADPGRAGLAVDYGASADNFTVYTEPVVCPTESITSLKDQLKLELSGVANYDSATAAIGSVVLPARSLLGFRLEVESLDADALTFINEAKSKKAVITVRRRV